MRMRVVGVVQGCWPAQANGVIQHHLAGADGYVSVMHHAGPEWHMTIGSDFPERVLLWCGPDCGQRRE